MNLELVALEFRLMVLLSGITVTEEGEEDRLKQIEELEIQIMERMVLEAL